MYWRCWRLILRSLSMRVSFNTSCHVNANGILLATWHGLYIKQYTLILHVAKIVTIDFSASNERVFLNTSCSLMPIEFWWLAGRSSATCKITNRSPSIYMYWNYWVVFAFTWIAGFVEYFLSNERQKKFVKELAGSLLPVSYTNLTPLFFLYWKCWQLILRSP